MTEPDLLWPHLRDLPFFRGTLRAVEARLVRRVPLPPPVLDIGCGDGHFASVAFDRPLDVGVDPDLRALREARRRGAYRLLLQADGARLPYPDAAFASAISNSVLEHIPHLDAVLAEVARVLRPGAPFVLTVPNPGYARELTVPKLLRRLGLARLAEAYRDWFMRMSRTVHLLDEAGWREKLSQAGFDVLETCRYFSPRALAMLEWGHYLGGPCLVARWLTGRWILAPWRWNLFLTERWVRRYYEEAPVPDGTYNFYLARRRME